MLVWMEGIINRTISVLQYCIPLIKVHSSSSRSTGLGFDLAWFSSVSSERLCDLHDAIYI